MKPFSWPKTILLILLICGVVSIFLFPTYYFYNKYKKTEAILRNYPLVASTDDSTIIAQVKALMDVPADENPTVATVTDISKVKDQPFFAKAKNGDKVLIYAKAKRAILYDPIEGKILEIGPVVSPQNAQSQNGSLSGMQTSENTKPPKVAIYNGTATSGVISTIERNLKDNGVDVDVVVRDYAKRRDYSKSLVVDLTGTNKTQVQRISTILTGDIATIPVGEVKPVASDSATPIDILVIIGATLTPSAAPTTKKL